MAYQLKDGQGALFPNKNRTNPRAPNATGKIMVDGKIYFLSAWTNTRDDGSKWQSLKAKLSDESAQAPPSDDDPGF